MIPSFDTSVLLDEIPPQEVAALVQQAQGAQKRLSGVALVALVVVCLAVWMVCSLGMAQAAVDSFSLRSPVLNVGSYIFLGGALAAGIGFFLQSRGEDPELQLARLERFVQRNGLRHVKDPKRPRLTGFIFEQGHEPRSEVRFRSGPGHPFPFEIARYSYRTGPVLRDRSKRPTRVNWTYLALTAGRSLPRTLLDAKKNDHWLVSSVPASLASSQLVPLPDGLQDHFKLYAPDGHAPEALQMFTPGVLDMLRRVAPDFDVETADDQIIFFTRKYLDLHKTQSWEQFSQLVFGVGAAMVTGVEERLAPFAGSTPAAALPGRTVLRRSRMSPALLMFAGAGAVLLAARLLLTGPLAGLL